MEVCEDWDKSGLLTKLAGVRIAAQIDGLVFDASSKAFNEDVACDDAKKDFLSTQPIRWIRSFFDSVFPIESIVAQGIYPGVD